MTHTNSPSACEAAGNLLLAYLDRSPSSDRRQLQELAEFLQSIGAVRDGMGNRQADAITLTLDIAD